MWVWCERGRVRVAYEKPEISDYGTIEELTNATGFVGPEDGGSKLLVHHSGPI